MKTINRVVEFKADEYDVRSTPYLIKGEAVRGIVTGFTSGDNSKAIVTAIIGNHVYKFYKFEEGLTVVERRYVM